MCYGVAITSDGVEGLDNAYHEIKWRKTVDESKVIRCPALLSTEGVESIITLNFYHNFNTFEGTDMKEGKETTK